jgi:NTE family protein
MICIRHDPLLLAIAEGIFVIGLNPSPESRRVGRTFLSVLATLALIIVLVNLQGCANVYKPQNLPLKIIDSEKGYRMTGARKGDYGDHLIFLAFSGGGTRAAALSYGVLQELRDTQVLSHKTKTRLLDEVDSISSVSGGSFTAAYYGLFGDRLFTDYEDVFLRQSIQGTLIGQLFDPVYWWRSLFSGFDRTEMAIEYYDDHIFEGKKFSDIRVNTGPYIEINATDLAGGNRFAFVQGYFDLICSDLDSLSVARAVTASSAVPVAFPTVVLKNHTGQCDVNQSRLVRYLNGLGDSNLRMNELKRRVKSYTDAKGHPYIHLVDGGVADNLGLRALIDRIETMGAGIFLTDTARMPKDVLVVSVDAEVTSEHGIDQSAAKPSLVDTLDAFSNAQFELYNKETRLLLDQKLNDMDTILKARGHNLKFYKAHVTFDSIQAKTLKSYFNSLPTSLELSDVEVDMLIKAGRELLRGSEGFKAFKADNAAGPVRESGVTGAVPKSTY